MRHKPLFIGIPGGIKNVEKFSLKELVELSGRNTGNFLFVAADMSRLPKQICNR